MKTNDRQKCQKRRSEQELHGAASENHPDAPVLSGLAAAHLTQSSWVLPGYQRWFTATAERAQVKWSESSVRRCAYHGQVRGKTPHILRLPTRKAVPGRRRREHLKWRFDSPQQPSALKSRAQIVPEKARRRSGVGACHRKRGGVDVYSNPGEHTEESEPQPGSNGHHGESASYKKSAQLHLRVVSSCFFILENMRGDESEFRWFSLALRSEEKQTESIVFICS